MKIEVHFLDENEKAYKKIFINDVKEQAIYIGDGIHDFDFENDEPVEYLTLN